MQQLMEFAANNVLLVGGFVAVLVMLIVSEITRRGSGFRIISTAEAVALMNQHDANIVDVSPAADFSKGHIIGAKNIAMSRLDEADKEIKGLLAGPTLVACKSGQTAQQAAAKLIKLGAENVSVLKGGMAQWAADNYPVTKP